MTKYVHTIGDLLKNHRLNKGFTIIQIATFLSLSDKYLSDIERNRRGPPNYATLLRWGTYLGISEKDLMWSAARYYNERKEKQNKKGI